MKPKQTVTPYVIKMQKKYKPTAYLHQKNRNQTINNKDVTKININCYFFGPRIIIKGRLFFLILKIKTKFAQSCTNRYKCIYKRPFVSYLCDLSSCPNYLQYQCLRCCLQSKPCTSERRAKLRGSIRLLQIRQGRVQT